MYWFIFWIRSFVMATNINLFFFWDKYFTSDLLYTLVFIPGTPWIYHILGPFMLPASPLIRTIFLFSPKFEIRQSYSWLRKENETSLKLKRILCYSVKQFCMHCLDFWFFFFNWFHFIAQENIFGICGLCFVIMHMI